MTDNAELIRSYADRIRAGERPIIGRGLVDVVKANRDNDGVSADCRLIMDSYPSDFPLHGERQAI